MPAESKAQQQAVAIAKNEPDKLYARNASLLKMSNRAKNEFVRTPTKGLPKHKNTRTTLAKSNAMYP